MTETARYGATYAPLRAEVDVRDCEVSGAIPAGLSGGFYAVGPDPQYPLAPGNISFDGEGHVRLFRIRNGRVDYRTRYVRTERYVAQDKAGRALMPMYRNPLLDDPSVKGLSRSTANTHVIQHRHLLLALKEDSPPTALDLDTLETLDPVYTFEGQLPRDRPFTAHPKICSITGNLVAFAYEARGLGSDAVAVFEIDKAGRKIWEVEVRAPYAGMLHDFAVTENHLAFFLVPITVDHAQMRRGGIHFSWEPGKSSFLGILRRGGDGADLRWIEGPTLGGSHTLGAFEDGGRLYFDREITAGNPYPVIPNRDGSAYDPLAGTSYIHRITASLSERNSACEIEKLYPLIAPLPRQDDRYATVPYRYGFMGCPDPQDPVRWKAGCYARIDHQTRRFELWKAPPSMSLGEPLFAPKSATAHEGEGYLLGVGWHLDQHLRSDLLIFEAERLAEGPIATVRLPVQASPQIHGWWVREDQYPR